MTLYSDYVVHWQTNNYSITLGEVSIYTTSSFPNPHAVSGMVLSRICNLEVGSELKVLILTKYLGQAEG